MIIVITGTRTGIGQAMAEYFLAQGDTVIGCSRSGASINHREYTHFEVDVSDEDQVKGMFRHVRKRFGYIDVLLNNAGIAAMNHSMLTPKASVSRMMETNLVGTFLCSREAAKLLKNSKQGRIVNFSSVALPLRLEGSLAYSASKAAVVALTEIMSKELAEWGVTVNAVGASPVPTRLTKTVPREVIHSLIERQTIKRMGTFEDVVNVVRFFIGPGSDFVTGQTLYLGGVVS